MVVKNYHSNSIRSDYMLKYGKEVNNIKIEIEMLNSSSYCGFTVGEREGIFKKEDALAYVIAIENKDWDILKECHDGKVAFVSDLEKYNIISSEKKDEIMGW